MKFYPAYLDLRGRSCLVVGGGAVAERKAHSLIDAGANVTVVSPELTPKLRDLARAGAITVRSGKFEPADVEKRVLVIAATDSAEVNSAVARACRDRNILVNVVSPPEESSFIVPSVVERGDLLIALSTSGSSPALARRLRKDLESRYGPEYGLFLDLLASVRKRVMAATKDERERRGIFQALVDSDVVELLRQGKREQAEARIRELARV